MHVYCRGGQREHVLGFVEPSWTVFRRSDRQKKIGLEYSSTNIHRCSTVYDRDKTTGVFVKHIDSPQEDSSRKSAEAEVANTMRMHACLFNPQVRMGFLNECEISKPSNNAYNPFIMSAPEQVPLLMIVPSPERCSVAWRIAGMST